MFPEEVRDYALQMLASKDAETKERDLLSLKSPVRTKRSLEDEVSGRVQENNLSDVKKRVKLINAEQDDKVLEVPVSPEANAKSRFQQCHSSMTTRAF